MLGMLSLSPRIKRAEREEFLALKERKACRLEQ